MQQLNGLTPLLRSMVLNALNNNLQTTKRGYTNFKQL
jgi:hypothetical protein